MSTNENIRRKGGSKLFILAILALIVIWGVGVFNKLVTSSEKVDAQWGNVENVYQRRADLIPNIVETVKAYATHERETFKEAIEARSKATSVNIDANNLTPESMQQFQQAQDGLASALSKLLVVVERYPDLKANQNFLELQAQLEGTENRIANERRKFNEIAREFNTKVKKFPTSILASITGFSEKPYFQAKEGADEVPKVDF